MTTRLIGLLPVVSLCLLTGCTNPAPDSDGGAAGRNAALGGRATIRVEFAKPGAQRLTATPADVVRVELLVLWEGGQTPPFSMTKIGPTAYELTIENLPVGTPLRVEAVALASGGQALFIGAADDIVLTQGAVYELLLNLIAANSGGDAGPGPRVAAARLPLAPVPVGSVFPMEFDLLDGDDVALKFVLTATPAGAFSPAQGPIALTSGAATLRTSFTAPATEGAVLIRLVVTDAIGLESVFEHTLSVVPPPPATQPGKLHSGVNFAPVLEAVRSRFVDAATIELLAHVSDDSTAAPDLRFRWSVSGAPFSTSNPASHPAEQGPVRMLLEVTDEQGATTSASFILDTDTAEVSDLPLQNRPPYLVGVYLSRQDVSYGDVVTATLVAEDPESAALDANWAVDWGTILATRRVQEGTRWRLAADWTGDVDPGAAHLTGTVADPLGGSVAYTFEIRQILGRVPLTANAGPDQATFIGSPFTLDGTASVSGNGQITSWKWEQVSGPASTIADANAPVTSVTPTAVGNYAYRLTVRNVNNVSTDTVSVAVSDPGAFAFVDALADDRGRVYFLDTVSRRVRRYDTPTASWLPSFATGDLVLALGVAPEGGVIYVSYEGGRIDKIDTATGVRTVFATHPVTVNRLYVCGGFIYTQDPSGAWATRSLYNRTTGQRTYSAEWTYTSNGFEYDPVSSRLFHFRDGTSPNDIMYTVVDQQAGTLSPITESPYHGGYSFTHPIRLFPDRNRVAVASGTIFSTADLTAVGGLGMSYTDLRFHEDRPHLIRPSGTQTQHVVLNPDFSVLSSTNYPGTPLRLWVFDGKAFLFTQQQSRVTVTIVNLTP